MGCNDNSTLKNTGEQTQTINKVESTPSVSVPQNDTFNADQQHLPKTRALPITPQVLIRKNCNLPPVITLEDTENTPIKETATQQPFPKPESTIFNKKSQFLSFNAQTETLLRGAEGTILTIPADCFETKTGDILRGVGQMEMKEFLTTSDMLLAHLSTQSDDKLLETAGMIYLNAKDAQGQPVKIRSEKNIKITLPPSAKTADKRLFYGNQQTDGSINWTVAKPSVSKQNASNFTIVEQNAEFPNGQAALFRFLQNKLEYPEAMRQTSFEGTVYVGFTVLPEGSLGNIHIKRGLSGGFNEEAIKVVKKMPRWKPARSQGVRVPMSYILPIKFGSSAPSVATGESAIDSSWIPQDTAYANKYLEILDEQEDIMRSNRLGWINCDRFLNLQNTTDFVVQTNKNDADIHLVFKNFRSIISKRNILEAKTLFNNVPIGEPVFIVATSPEGNQFNISVTEVVITKQQMTSIELKTVEKDVFLKELRRLDALK